MLSNAVQCCSSQFAEFLRGLATYLLYKVFNDVYVSIMLLVTSGDCVVLSACSSLVHNVQSSSLAAKGLATY